jgi:malic enzyme
VIATISVMAGSDPATDSSAAAAQIASAVAIAAVHDDVAPPATDDELQHRVRASQWTPRYDPSTARPA